MKAIVEIDVELGQAIEKVAVLTKEMEANKKTVKTLKDFNMENSAEYVNSQKKISLLREEIKGYNQIIQQYLF